VIESTGISEPLPVAETFTFRDENGMSLGDSARLDTMVTVVDAANFPRDYHEALSLKEKGESLGEEDDRNVADLLVDQIEFCDVLVISKTDLIDTEALASLTAVLRRLNPEADIVHANRGQIPLDRVLDTGRFDFERASLAPGWLKEMRGEHKPETEEYGIGSFVYQATRPFHPERLHHFLSASWRHGHLLRSKGFFWLATRPDMAGSWSQAGGIMHHGYAGLFWAAVPEAQWPEEPQAVDQILRRWAHPYGDRRQEIVFIGQHMDVTAARSALDTCLLTDTELARGPNAWRALPDPFPHWTQEQPEEATADA